jgi:hypothetical protein
VRRPHGNFCGKYSRFCKIRGTSCKRVSHSLALAFASPRGVGDLSPCLKYACTWRSCNPVVLLGGCVSDWIPIVSLVEEFYFWTTDDGSAFFSLRKSICDRNQHGAVIAHGHALLVCWFVFLFFSMRPSFLKLSSHILRFFIDVVAMFGHCLFFSSSSSEETNDETLAAVVCDVKSSRALSVGRTPITIPFMSSK